MERRKLQATGGSSLTITLPKDWTSRWKLKSKDEVLVNNAGYGLIIKPAIKTRSEISVQFSIDKMPNEWLLREMIGAYIGGADKITLKSERITPAQNHTIRQAVQLLFGFEILEETSKKIAARTVLNDTMFPVSDSTLRTFMICRGMFEDALMAAKAGDKDLADDIKLRDYEVNKLVHVIKRQFNEIVSGKIEGDLKEVGYYRSVAGQLERIGDHAVKIAELVSTNRTETVKLSSTFPIVQGKINDLLRDVEKMLRNLDKELANKIIDRGTELEHLVYSSRRMKQSYEGAIIEDSLDRLRSYLINIAEMTIDYKLIA